MAEIEGNGPHARYIKSFWEFC